MKVIISTRSQAMQESIAHKLISHGITIIPLCDLIEIEAALPFISNICMLDESVYDKKELYQMIIRIKQDAEKASSRIILLAKNYDLQILKQYSQIGVDGILQSTLHRDTIADRLLKFILHFGKQNTQRKYVRINLDEGDKTELKFLIPNTKMYQEGKITDISMGGLAVRFAPKVFDLIEENKIYSRSQLRLENNNLFVDLKLLKKGGDMACFIFDHLQNTFRENLAEYIYKKIQQFMEG